MSTLFIAFFKGSISSFGTVGTVEVNTELVISCKITSFASGQSATFNRNGSLLNTCFPSNLCSDGSTKTINGMLFTFTGDSTGIHLTIDSLPQTEIGVLYTCIKDVSVNYTVAISKYPFQFILNIKQLIYTKIW